MRPVRQLLLKCLVNISVPWFMCAGYLFLGAFVFRILNLEYTEITLVSPFLEEFMRYLSILIGGYVQYLFTLFFSVGEFIDHVFHYSDNHGGYVPFTFIVFRFVCVIAHFLLLAIQLFGFRLARKYNSKLCRYMGLWGAILWHFAFNSGLGTYVHNVIVYLYGLF